MMAEPKALRPEVALNAKEKSITTIKQYGTKYEDYSPCLVVILVRNTQYGIESTK